MKARIFLASVIVCTILAACASNNKKQPRPCTNAPAGQYCIRPGDNLTRLSQRFNVSIADLRSWNNLPNDIIHVGNKLIIRPNSTSTKTSIKKTALSFQMPVNGYIIKNYTNMTKGIDIAAPRGTLVCAAADGTVIYAGSNIASYGKMLLIRHNATTITAYANNENLLVPINAKVKTGQIIAEVGDSGRRDGKTALHFEIRINGKHTNPMNYIR